MFYNILVTFGICIVSFFLISLFSVIEALVIVIGMLLRVIKISVIWFLAAANFFLPGLHSSDYDSWPVSYLDMIWEKLRRFPLLFSYAVSIKWMRWKKSTSNLLIWMQYFVENSTTKIWIVSQHFGHACWCFVDMLVTLTINISRPCEAADCRRNICLKICISEYPQY